MAGLCAPLSTLRQHPRGYRRMTRGQCGCRVEVPVTRHLPHRSHRAAFPQWALVEGQTRSRVGAWQPNLPPTRRRAASVTRRPGSESGACVAARLSFDRPPFLHSLRCRFVVGFVRGFIGTTQPSDSSRLPQQLRLLDFLSWPGIAVATAGGVRSPRFRRDPFIRDVASDPGRATVPRVTAPHMLPSAIATASAPATSRISWLNPTPQMITVYASPWSSPSPTQHSLPGGRYPLPGPDFHRLDRASFAWRTTNPSPPSGWVEDFHLRAIEHARHTTNPLSRDDARRGRCIFSAVERRER